MNAEQCPSTWPQILVIDDDEAMLRGLFRALRSGGFQKVLLCQDPRDACAMLEQNGDVGVILLDLVMPHIPGEELLEMLTGKAPETPVIIVSATDEVDSAVRCLKLGAFDYLVKPIDFTRLISDIERAIRHRQLQVENRALRNQLMRPELKHPEVFSRIVGHSPAMLSVCRYVEAIAPSSEPVLIVGETGVGKELIAEAVHVASGVTGELVCVNVAGLDEPAFADTLCGHVKGAFTGADRDRAGLIEKSAGGTLFLDEIGDLGLEMQTKLLRLLQEREFLPLGTDRPSLSSCRIIAATNRDLRQGMQEGCFREDLYYRLHSHLVRVPPLRERREDIQPLVDHFLNEAATSLDKPSPTPPKELYVHLSSYAFPGNVRELRAMMMDAVARHERGVLSLEAFLKHMRGTEESALKRTAASGESLCFGAELPTLREATECLIREALQRSDQNQAVAARLLGLSRRTVNRYAMRSASGSKPMDP